MKQYLLYIAVIVILAIAVIRVYPYIHNTRKNNKPVRETTVVSKIPTYDSERLASGVDDLRESVYETVYSRLLEINEAHRPAEPEAKEIAGVYTEYLMRNRLGSLQDILAVYNSRGIPPSQSLVQDDAERANNAWMLSTAWARYRPTDISSLSASAKYYKGKRVNQRFVSAAISERPLADGTLLYRAGSHGYSAYEISVRAVVPDLNGKTEFSVLIWVTIINDMPGGKWDVIQTTWSDLPPGHSFRLPYP